MAIGEHHDGHCGPLVAMWTTLFTMASRHIDDDEMTASGRPFQTWASATGKALPPTVDSSMGVWPSGWYLLTAKHADQVGQRWRQEVPDIVARCRAELCTLALRSCTARVLYAFVNFTYVWTCCDIRVVPIKISRSVFVTSGAFRLGHHDSTSIHSTAFWINP